MSCIIASDVTPIQIKQTVTLAVTVTIAVSLKSSTNQALTHSLFFQYIVEQHQNILSPEL